LNDALSALSTTVEKYMFGGKNGEIRSKMALDRTGDTTVGKNENPQNLGGREG
jgi:hypothetical protein